MSLPTRIIPRYRLLMRYDIKSDLVQPYYQFVMNEFVPSLHEMGLYMTGVWHTAYGSYPLRQVEFISDSLSTFREVFQSERWEELEKRLKSYTLHYERKLVRFHDRFQF